MDVKGENLIELAADGILPQEKIRKRLRDIARSRETIHTCVKDVHQDLTSGRQLLEAQIALLEHPYELYLGSTDEVRRELNQATFKAIYICNDEVTGDELNSPMAELPAAERGWVTYNTTSNEKTAVASAIRVLPVLAGSRFRFSDQVSLEGREHPLIKRRGASFLMCEEKENQRLCARRS